MRNISFTVALLLLGTSAICQNSQSVSRALELTETDSLYVLAFDKYVSEIEAYKNELAADYMTKTVYVQSEDYLIKIPGKINGYKIQEVNLTNRRKIFKQNGRKLIYVKVSPLTLQDGDFYITFIPYTAQMKSRDKYNFELSVWTKVIFKFEEGKLIFQRIEHGGL